MPIPGTLSDVTGPLLGEDRVGEADFDLTVGHAGEPLGQKIVLHGRVLDGNGQPVPDTLVEVWQANAAGRYWHTRSTPTRRRSTPTSPASAAA